MKHLIKYCIVFLLLGLVQANDFSSFLSANASLAVVVDDDYMLMHGENILEHFQKIFSDIIRENLKNGGVNVKYYTWNSARLKKDFLAAITVSDCENTWKFYRNTQETSVLLIAITDAHCPRLPIDRALMIPLVEHGDEFPQLILDAKVQQILKWRTAVVFVDQNMLDANYMLVKSIMQESTRNHLIPISLIYFKINNTLRGQMKRNHLREILKQFAPIKHELKQQQFIVISRFHEDLIEVAGNLKMFHINNQWLFFVLAELNRNFNPYTVTANLNEGANIAFARNETEPDCMDTLNCTISEVSMAFVTSISRMINEEQSIYGEISDEEWESIRFTKQEKQDELLEYIKDYLKANSKCASCAKWRLESAITWGKSQEYREYRLAPTRDAPNRNFEFLNIGYWSPLLGFVCQELTFPHIEHHFRNITMNIVTMHNPPWQILSRNPQGGIAKHTGIVMEILKELSRALNFTYILHEVKDWDEYDVYGQNFNESDELLGSMTFLIPQQVLNLLHGHNKKYFMAAVAATVDEPNTKSFNYTIPISVQKYSFIARQPDEISRIYLFTAPFTPETWACLVASIIVTAPMLYGINCLVPLPHLKIEGLSTVKSCFWYVYGALLQQGGMYLPKADSGRLIVGFWWIVVIVLVTTYCGNLVAFLTFPKFQPGIDYLYELFTHNEVIQYGLRNGTLFEKYAMSTTRQDFQRFVEHATIYNNTQNENIDAVKSGERVNIDWRINLQLIVQNHFEEDKECRFALGKENFLDEQIALMVPLDSAYLTLINEHINRMFRMGFIERWHQMNLPSMDKCNGKNVLRQITNHKVNLEDMQGCFLVLLFGFVFALIVICSEFWYHRLYVAPAIQKQRTFAN